LGVAATEAASVINIVRNELFVVLYEVDLSRGELSRFGSTSSMGRAFAEILGSLVVGSISTGSVLRERLSRPGSTLC
jgi:hypothetical protein